MIYLEGILSNPAIANVFAFISLILSLCIFWRTRNSERKEAISSQQADLVADFITEGNTTQLHIANQGQAPAYNVRLYFPSGHDPVIQQDAEEKFPMDAMAVQQKVVLITAFHKRSPSKIPLTISWNDQNKKPREKVLELTR